MKVTLPRHTTKHISWNKDGNSCSAFILIGYCPDTLAYFQAMAEKLKETFPQVKDEDITCGKVTQSDCIKGFTVIMVTVEIQRTLLVEKGLKALGWTERDVNFNY